MTLFFVTQYNEKFFWLWPLLLYAVLTYSTQGWFLFPFFLASCFYALCLWIRPRHSSFNKLWVYIWSLIAAFILIFPCLMVLLEFHSFVAISGAFFLLGYTTGGCLLLVLSLRFLGHVFTKPLLRLVLWSGIFVAWWWFIDSFFFTCVGISCGYVIANPILCSATSPYFCILAQVVGVYGLLTLYVGIAGGCVFWLLYHSRASGNVALVLLSFFIAAAFYVKPLGKPSQAKAIIAFKMPSEEKSVLKTTLEFRRQILVLNERATQPELIVGPESCLPCELNNEPSLCILLDNYGYQYAPLVLLGAQRQDKTTTSILKYRSMKKTSKFFNSAFLLHQGRIIYYYDKNFPLPFLESYSSNSFLRGLFSIKENFFRKAENSEENLFLSKGKPPYSIGATTNALRLPLGGVVYSAHLALCSDFFCTKDVYAHSLAGKKNPLLIVLTNDVWFYGMSVAYRMHRYATLWAMCNKIPVLYVGYCCTSWIEPSGSVWSLEAVES